MGAVNILAKFFGGSVLLYFVLLCTPGIPPHVNFVPFEVDPVLPREGPLAKNFILDDGERMFEDQLISPESLASRATNELFVSLQNGSIARIWGNNFENARIVASIGPGCAGPWEEHICGRPLGLRFLSSKILLVADGYLGIFELDVETGKKVLLVDPETPIEGIKPKIFDDLDIDENGNIYWSDASTNVILSDGLVELLSEPSGRLIKYDPKTKLSEVLIPKVHFANGVQLSADKQFVLVSETFGYRVLRYWLKGPKAGSSDVFVSGLPGMPDNIRPRRNGGFYISLVTVRNPDAIDLHVVTATWTGFRKVTARATAIFQMALNFINSCLPNNFCAIFTYKIFHLGVASEMFSNAKESIIVEVNENGDIIGSLQGSRGIIQLVSQTEQVGDSLFFGSPYKNFLGRLRLHTKPVEKPSTKKEERKLTDKVEL